MFYSTCSNPAGLKPVRRGGGLGSSVAMLFAISGCGSLGTIVDPFNVLGSAQPPIRIGVTTMDFSPPPNMLHRRSLFQHILSFHLGEPVTLDLLTPRQIRIQLMSGRLKFAILKPEDFSEVNDPEHNEILAVPINTHADVYRRGLIITAPQSLIQSLTDLKQKRFHFLPRDDVLNEAALGALLEAGLTKEELDQGILGLGLDTHHINSLEVAKSVVLEGKVAGVIDEADYNRWPEKGGSLLLLSPSQEQVRVIGKTVKVPEGPILASLQNDPELTVKMKDYLFRVVRTQKLVLASMDCTGFAEPIDPSEYKQFTDLYLKLHPPEPEESIMETEPVTEPASG